MSEEVVNQEPKPEVNSVPEVKPEAYEQIKSDMFRYKTQLKDAQVKQAEYEAKLKEFEELKDQNLADNNNFKELWEKQKQRADENEVKYKDLQGALVENEKLSVIEKAALSAGLSKKAVEDLRLLDTSSVVVESTSTGRLNVLGHDEFVNELKQSRPHWFNDSKPPVVNNSTGSYHTGDSKSVTMKELGELEKSNKPKYRDMMLKLKRKEINLIRS